MLPCPRMILLDSRCGPPSHSALRLPVLAHRRPRCYVLGTFQTLCMQPRTRSSFAHAASRCWYAVRADTPPGPSSVSRCVRAPHVASCSCACARQLRRAEAYMRLGSFDRAAADLAQVATSPPSSRVAPGSALSFQGPAPSGENRMVGPAGARSCPEERIRRARARGAGAAYPHRLWRDEAHFRSHVRRVAAPSALVSTALLAAAASGRGE